MIVSNVSASIGTSFASAFYDTRTKLLWISTTTADRCHGQCGHGVAALWTSDMRRWESAQALPKTGKPVGKPWDPSMAFFTCNTEVTSVVGTPPAPLPPHRYGTPRSLAAEAWRVSHSRSDWFAPHAVMIADPWHILLNNEPDGNLSKGWFDSNATLREPRPPLS